MTSRLATNADELALALRAERTVQGKSQLEVAEAAGFSQSCISHYENGLRSPWPENLVAWAEALGYTVEVIFWEKNDEAK